VLEAADGDLAQVFGALGEDAKRDGLAGPGLTGDEGKPALVGEPMLDAPGEVLEPGREVQRLEGQVGGEGVELQAIEGLDIVIHDPSSGSGLGCLGR